MIFYLYIYKNKNEEKLIFKTDQNNPVLSFFRFLTFLFVFYLIFVFGNAVFAKGNDPAGSAETSKIGAIPSSGGISHSDTDHKVIRVMFHNQPSVSFLGSFAAKELGIFDELGLPPVEFIWENDYSRKIDSLMQGNLDIINCWMAEGIHARANGIPIVALALLSQKSTSCFMVRRDLDPTLIDLKSLQGRKIPLWAHYELTPLAFLATQKIKIIPIVQRSETNMLFNEGVVKACFATMYTHVFFSNYLEFRNAIQIFRFSDYGVDFPENTFFCRESFMRNHPDLCRKYILGVFKGWEKIIERPDLGVDILSRYCDRAGILSNQFLLKKQLEIWLSYMDFQKDLQKNGFCTKQRYDKLVEAMVLSGTIEREKSPSFHEFFYPILNDDVLMKLQQAPKKANP